ncbi:hypothetical protein BJY04DRAFT_214311 [Aspergillus karnatakaensis]|uniref:fungal specific transcription factor domain-containing protein n=1 Tax=Aspergillus karnatakaensis TaxID=1810916 RepID=UPI003CCCD6D3
MAQEYVDCFCEHSNATYRYVPRSQIQNLMDGFYAQDEQVLQNDADVAVLLLVMAVGDQSRDDTVLGIERGIETWLQETASFFHPTDEHENERDGHMAFCDIPWILKRQQRTVRAAFHFTTILLYRGYLLDEFLQRNVPRPQPSSCSPAVERCVKAALRLAEFAAEIDTDTSYNPVYWVTSHFTFCAISILTVYMTLYKDPEQQNVIETVLEKAMRGHRKLDNSKNKQSQQLLEESRSIAQAVQSSPIASSTLTTAQPREVRLSSDQPTDHNQPNCCPNEASNLENEDTLVELYNEASWDSQSFASILHGEGLGVIMNVGFDTSLSPFIGIVPT